jgi:hypothetical protein
VPYLPASHSKSKRSSDQSGSTTIKAFGNDCGTLSGCIENVIRERRFALTILGRANDDVE